MIKSTESNMFSFSFSEVKTLIENGVDVRALIERLNDQPDFIKHMGVIDSLDEIFSISQGGCNSGAYMPATTYHTALDCMTEHGDEVADIISEHCVGVSPFDLEEETFAGYCSRLCCTAVELWVSSVYSDLECLDNV